MNYLKDLSLTSDDVGNTILIMVTEQDDVGILLQSIYKPLKINTKIWGNEIEILIPTAYGNGTLKMSKPIDSNQNWLQINLAQFWTVGHFEDERLVLTQPLHQLAVDSK